MKLPETVGDNHSHSRRLTARRAPPINGLITHRPAVPPRKNQFTQFCTLCAEGRLYEVGVWPGQPGR
jgi:hypothetical protein